MGLHRPVGRGQNVRWCVCAKYINSHQSIFIEKQLRPKCECAFFKATRTRLNPSCIWCRAGGVCVCVVTDVSSDVEAGCVCVVTDMSSGVEEEHSCRVARDLWVSVEDLGYIYKNTRLSVMCFFFFFFRSTSE